VLWGITGSRYFQWDLEFESWRRRYLIWALKDGKILIKQILRKGHFKLRKLKLKGGQGILRKIQLVQFCVSKTETGLGR
jgi:hypothetical protein